jgi:hypothetical protein
LDCAEETTLSSTTTGLTWEFQRHRTTAEYYY